MHKDEFTYTQFENASTRLKNCLLYEAEIKTIKSIRIEDVAKISAREWLRAPNFGQRTLRELSKILEANGYPPLFWQKDQRKINNPGGRRGKRGRKEIFKEHANQSLCLLAAYVENAESLKKMGMTAQEAYAWLDRPEDA